MIIPYSYPFRYLHITKNVVESDIDYSAAIHTHGAVITPEEQMATALAYVQGNRIFNRYFAVGNNDIKRLR